MRVIQRRAIPDMFKNTERTSTDTVLLKEKKDLYGILLLILLYILQGIPLGLAAAIPFLLQSDVHTANYKYQAIFSWVFWPFSLKLAWAPIVDAVYSSRLGRRKTWLIPLQYAIAVDLFVLSGRVDKWLGREDGKLWGPLGVASSVNIYALTVAFFGLTLLAATQDIVVDGWALTMLSKERVGWASTCNSVGQSVGYILAFIVLLSLESPDVCNNYLRSEPVPGEGIISFSGFLFFWAIVFIVCTTLVAIFKSEDNSSIHSSVCSRMRRHRRSSCFDDAQLLIDTSVGAELQIHPSNDADDTFSQVGEEQEQLTLKQTYVVMFGVLRLRPVLNYICFVFLVKFVFSASDNVFGLKLLENGVSKERMALLGTIVLPLQALLPILVTHWSNGPRPIGVYLSAAIPRSILAALTIAIIHYTPFFRQEVIGSSSQSPVFIFSNLFYALILVKFAVYSVFAHTMFVCQMSFHARVSDPSIGGTYMTLLNTAVNLAGSLPATLMLYLVDPLTFRTCVGAKLDATLDSLSNSTNFSSNHLSPEKLQILANDWLLKNATCSAGTGVQACTSAGGTCHTLLDGFYIEVGVCILVGIVSFCTVLRPIARYLDTLPLSAYRLVPAGAILASRRL